MKMSNKNIFNGILLFSMLVIASCAYDEADHLIDGKGPNQLRFFGGQDKLVVAPSLTSTVTIGQVYKDANSEAALAKDASVTYAVNAAVVDAYNAGNGTSFVALPADKFAFSPATLVMGPGEFQKNLVIQLNADGLDLSQEYAIGLTGTADGWEVVGDQFLQLVIVSPYEGDYTSIGTRYNYNAAGDANVTNWPPSGFVSTGPWNFPSTAASTIKTNTVAVHAANSDGGFGRINLTVTNTPFDSDNNGSMESFVVNIVPNDDIGLLNLIKSTHRQSYYTPATESFKLYYEYTNANGTFRNLEHNMTKN
jgi:hypothetical protein